MKSTDLIKFLTRRARKDTPKAFISRLLRFGIILIYKALMNMWWNDLLYNLRGKGEYVISNIMGSEMQLAVNDGGISRDLLYNGIREPYANKKLIRLLKPDDVVVEIGANIGYYALQEARIVKQVYAIEPTATNVAQLRRNIALNGYQNIAVYEMAIGDYDGEATLYVTDASNLCTLSKQSSHKHNKIVQVPIMTLDTFMENALYPSVIRMDVEGYEHEIVKGMSGILSQDKPLIIFMELHMDILGEKVVELAEILRDNHFDIEYASCEPHPAVMKSPVGCGLTGSCDKQIGASQGYVVLTIDDLINKPIYSSGQVEWLEVIFRR